MQGCSNHGRAGASCPYGRRSPAARLGAAALVLLALAGCESTPLDVVSARPGIELAFSVALRGEAVEVSGPLVPGGDQPARYTPRDAPDALYVVSMDGSQLEALAPALDRARVPESRLELKPETCEGGRLEGGRSVTLPLGADDAYIERVDLDSGSLSPGPPPSAMRLRLPTVHDRCVEVPSFEPFAATAALGEGAEALMARGVPGVDPSSYSRLGLLVPVGSQRAILASGAVLLLVRQGAPFVATPQTSLTLAEIAGRLDLLDSVQDLQLRGLGPVRTSSSGTRAPLALTVGERTWLTWLEVREDALALGEVFGEVSGAALWIHQDEAGRVLALGKEGLVVSWARGELRVGRVETRHALRVATPVPGDPDSVFAGGSGPVVFQLTDVFSDRPRIASEALMPPGSSDAMGGVGVRPLADGLEVYAAGYPNFLWRRASDGEWAEVRIDVPGACGVEEERCGWRKQSRSLSYLGFEGQEMVFVVGSCPSLMFARLDRGCSSDLRFDAEVTAAVRTPAGLLVAAFGPALYLASWP